MAINVDTVYTTVLLILNKEQKGYMTPSEFNSVGTQVQLDMFNNYFETLNQQLRIPENTSEYSNRVKNLQEKIGIFEGVGNCSYSAGLWSLPSGVDLYKLGTVIFNDSIEVQRVDPNELIKLNLSPLTKPTTTFPVYKYIQNKITVVPNTTTGISVTYTRKPVNPVWNFTIDAYGEYLYNSLTSVNFELHPEEQVDLITGILLYAGVIIKDPQVIQIAAQQAQANQINSKS